MERRTLFPGRVLPALLVLPQLLLTCVFFPAWLWGPMSRADTRFISFSYASALTERDNARFRDVIMSQEYRDLYGSEYDLKKIGETRISNSLS